MKSKYGFIVAALMAFALAVVACTPTGSGPETAAEPIQTESGTDTENKAEDVEETMSYELMGTRWVLVDNHIYLIDQYDGYIIDVIFDAWSW